MIYGIGTDIVSLDRINTIYSKNPDKFIQKVLSHAEQQQLEALNPVSKAQFLASRWAAKESMVKALGTGFGQGIYWSDISILNDKNGKPYIFFSEAANSCINKIITLSEDQKIKTHLSLSHEKSHSTAFVILEIIS